MSGRIRFIQWFWLFNKESNIFNLKRNLWNKTLSLYCKPGSAPLLTQELILVLNRVSRKQCLHQVYIHAWLWRHFYWQWPHRTMLHCRHDDRKPQAENRIRRWTYLNYQLHLFPLYQRAAVLAAMDIINKNKIKPPRVSKSCNHAITRLRKTFANLRKFVIKACRIRNSLCIWQSFSRITCF